MPNVTLVRAINCINSRNIKPGGRLLTDDELRRVARTSRDSDLLRIKGLGPNSLREFRKAYGAYNQPSTIERPEDV